MFDPVVFRAQRFHVHVLPLRDCRSLFLSTIPLYTNQMALQTTEWSTFIG